MSESDTSDAGRRKRPSARRPGAEPVAKVEETKPRHTAEVKPSHAPSPTPVAKRASTRKAAATVAVRAAVRAKARAAHAPQAPAPAPANVTMPPTAQNDATPSDGAQAEMQEVERDLDALLGDVQSVDGDAAARKRAAEAMSYLASRLLSEESVSAEQEKGGAHAGASYLSPDYYLRQLGQMGLRHRSQQVDDFGLDTTYEERVRPFLELICNKYFRTEIEGIEHIPSEGRALLVCNHGGSLPWDSVMLRTALRQHHPAHRAMRFLVEDSVFHAPFLGSFINRIGAVRACQENAERLLRADELVAVFPEGQKGSAKRYADRYRLQRFGRGGYIKLALRTAAPVIPVAVIGAEETYPLLYKVKAFSKALGMSYLPVTPTFPWLGPLGLAPLPSRWRIAIGEPVTDLARYDEHAASDEILVGELNERVRSQVQRLVSDTRQRRGLRAYL